MMKNLWIALLVIVLIILGYFGYKYLYKSKYSSNAPSATQTLGAPNTVSIANLAFSPAELTVAKGVEVTFKNEDSVTHTVVFENFGSPELKPGDTYKYAFDSAETFDYYCSVHPQMKGKIIVQ